MSSASSRTPASRSGRTARRPAGPSVASRSRSGTSAHDGRGVRWSSCSEAASATRFRSPSTSPCAMASRRRRKRSSPTASAWRTSTARRGSRASSACSASARSWRWCGRSAASLGEGLLRLDANGAYTVATARRVTAELAALGIGWLEDPCRTLDETARLRADGHPVSFSTHEPDLGAGGPDRRARRVLPRRCRARRDPPYAGLPPRL